MRIKKIIRMTALIFFIILASMIPVPMVIHHKDKLPQNLIEMVDKNEDENQDEEDAEIL